MKKLRSMLAFLLSVLMILTMVPAMSWAQGASGAEGTADESSRQSLADGAFADGAAMPGMEFTAEADGLSVRVIADEGAFPAGTTMKVTAIQTKDILDAVSEAVGGEVRNAAAADITFFDKEGSEIEPAAPVHVSLGHEMLSSETCEIVHIDDNGQVEKMEDVSIDTENETATLFSDQFSVYVVVGPDDPGDNARLTLTFHEYDGDVIAQMYVANQDLALSDDKFAKIVYDPGAGTVDANQIFKGWSIDTEADGDGADYDQDTQAYTIAGIRNYLKGLSIKEGDTLDVYAMLFNVYTVSYMDETYQPGVSEVAVTSEKVLYKPGKEAEYKIDVDYTPINQDSRFEGWTRMSGTIAPDKQMYVNGDKVVVKSDVVLMATAPDGHWLSFDADAAGASYTPPQFLKNTETTKKPNDPKRTGYSFVKWVDENGQDFVFGSTLAKTTTLKAVWKANTTANYTVVIWLQNLQLNGYDYQESVTLSGTTNSTINTVSQQGSGNSAYARINSKNYQYTGFHLDHFDTGKTIAPEGNTVVNVYYTRTEYTLTFQKNTGTFFSNWTTIKTITAKYGQDISANFPIVGSDNVNYSGYVWDPQNSSIFKTGQVPTLEIMPAENTVFHATQYGTSRTATYYYYLEKLPNETSGIQFQNKYFTEKTHADIDFSRDGFSVTKKEDFKDFEGFTQFGSDPAFGYNDTISVTSDGTKIKFYYTRNKYKIQYFDGAYVKVQQQDDGSNIDVPLDYPKRSDALSQAEEAYEASLSEYNEGGTKYFRPTAPDGFTFGGWYKDEACTDPYEFTTMPLGGINVYAKWIRNEYRVFLHPNVPKAETVTWGGQKMSFKILDGEMLCDGNMIEGERKNYTIIGWYKDEACTDPWKFEAYAVNGQTATGEYDQTQPTELDDHGNPTSDINKDKQENRFWITKKLDLYAKWRAELPGAKGIDVVYEAGDGKFADGTSTFTDPNSYPDNTDTYTQGAPVPNDTKHYQFVDWELMTWDGNQYVGTGKHVNPGEVFTVLKSNARMYDVVYEADGKTIKSAKYEVRLKANYVKLDEPTPTHISWYSNYGTENDGKGILYHKDDNILINQKVPVLDKQTRPGYTFLGWTKVKGGTEPWLVYHEAEGSNEAYWTCTDMAETYHVPGIAANENEPYDDMYAVWGNPYFYIYHSGVSSDQEGYLEKISLSEGKMDSSTDKRWKTGDNDTHVFDLTGKLTTDTLYGGYTVESGLDPEDTDAFISQVTTAVLPGASGADNGDGIQEEQTEPAVIDAYDGNNWEWLTMALDPGDQIAVDPEKAPGRTYIIKEVPKKYLEPRNYTYYDRYTKLMHQVYMITVLDDINYDSAGFDVAGSETGEKKIDGKTAFVSFDIGKLSPVEIEENGTKRTVYQYDPSDGSKVTINVSTLFTTKDADNNYLFSDTADYMYVAILYSSEDECRTGFSSEKVFIPYWITSDGMKVTSFSLRTIKKPKEENTYQKGGLYITSDNADHSVNPAKSSAGQDTRQMRVLETAPLGTFEFDAVDWNESDETACTAMYRLYNPNSGEHFYTASPEEKDSLLAEGWKDEDIAWYAPEISDTPVFRLYNPEAGDHHYTNDVVERDALVEAGWNDEGIGWYSDDTRQVPLFRIYNPNAYANGTSGAHHYTVSAEERDSLVALGWQDEGIAWYGLEVNN